MSSPVELLSITKYPPTIVENGLKVHQTCNSCCDRRCDQIQWKDLSFRVCNKSPFFGKPQISRKILQPQNGLVRSGEMMAIMGPSGCGKSTLLRCLTGQLVSNNGFNGEIIISSTSKSPPKIRFVEQRDTLFDQFTVYETILFATRLNSSSKSNCNLIANTLISQLDLTDVKDLTVGKISGGQRKRVAIGIEVSLYSRFLCYI